MTYPPQYDELYVLSDIHLGGRRDDQANFQIFNRGERLGNLIRHLAQQRSDEEVALVLNGDIIDSLAEDVVTSYVALDPEIAVTMMEHLYTDPSFKPVWEGLATFVNTPKRHLVFVVGNHDIELSLPVVENSIKRQLAKENADAMSRIQFATHGGGFACRVASARVFCTHGNEVDKWNWVDYNTLGQLANATNAGRTIDASDWKPNAGTRLVIDVMNAIKRQYPFVDLLKPEVAAVASVLLALDKDVFKHVDFGEAFPVLRDRIRGGLVKRKLLGPEATDFRTVSDQTIAEEATVQLLGPSFREAIETKRRSVRNASEDELLTAVESALAEGKRVTDTAAEQEAQQTLGAWDMVIGWVGLVPKVEGLRRALKDWLKDDTTFDVTSADDDLYKEMQQRVGPQVDFVVTGHTHKPRALRFKESSYYYNCGTWIRTLRLTNEVLDNPKAFEEILWPKLKAGRMDELDTAEIPGPNGKMVRLLYDQTNVVRISTQGNQVVGDLLRVTGGDDPSTLKIDPEPGTHAFKVG